MLQRNTLVDKCNAKFQQIFGDYNIQADGKIAVSHFGEFSQDLVNSLTVGIENMMIESGDKKGCVRRMFSILIEGLQNIRIHGERDADGNQVSFFIVLQNEDYYKITFGNLIRLEAAAPILERIENLNTMTEPEIKALYMDTLSNGIMSDKGGAGLGFITTALKSKNPIICTVEQVADDLAFFVQHVTLDRVKK